MLFGPLVSVTAVACSVLLSLKMTSSIRQVFETEKQQNVTMVFKNMHAAKLIYKARPHGHVTVRKIAAAGLFAKLFKYTLEKDK